MHVELRTRGFDELDRRLELAVSRLRAKLSQLISHHSRLLQVHVKKNAPVDTGELRNSIERAHAGLQAMVYSTADHAKPIEFGADPHEITPDKAGALAFFWEKVGEHVVFAQVDHPGNKPHRFMRRAIDQQWPQIEQSAKRVVGDAVQ